MVASFTFRAPLQPIRNRQAPKRSLLLLLLPNITVVLISAYAFSLRGEERGGLSTTERHKAIMQQWISCRGCYRAQLSIEAL